MKNKITLLAGLMAACLTVHAQNSDRKISGMVGDNEHQKLTAASVALLQARDSSIIKILVTDKEGRFDFTRLQAGTYLVMASAVGHEAVYSAPVQLTESRTSIELAPLLLPRVTKDMKAVTVVARKPLVEQKIDRMVVNVDAAVSNVGANALEVLEKSPGITVDKDGNISLKGKQGVQVYIDGKPSYLSGQDLVNLLNNMNANQLDQIEIMTNPPAKYDAAGNSGIINIKTKKNKAKGFNGSATAAYSQGKYWRTNESLNLNYRNGKVNLFGNYSYNRYNAFTELSIHRVYKQADGKTVSAIFDQVAMMKPSNSNHNLKLGADYYLTGRTTLGFVASGFYNPENFSNQNTSYLKNAAGQVDSVVYSNGMNKDLWKNATLNLNFRHQFDSTGRELTADLDYAGYTSGSSQRFVNASYEPDGVKRGQTDLRGELPVDIRIYSAKADYSQPLSKSWKLESGLKSSYVNTDNAANYYNLAGTDWETDYGKTNRFKYEENINAAYLNLSGQVKKFGVQAGLRFENTHYNGHQLGNVQKPDSSFSRTYNSLFPTLYLSYNLNDKNQFSANIGRRIDRPAYQDLNPFLFFLDNYTYQAGNPFLQPQYSTNIEIAHTYHGFLTTTLNYSRTRNFFTETFEQSDYATIVRQGNIGQRDNAGVSVSAQVPVAKWWSAMLYANYNYNRFNGLLYGEQIRVEASNVLFNVNNQFHFGKGWSAELSGFYRSRGVEGQIIINPLGQVSAGVSKQVLKGKGSVRFNIRDLFYTQNADGNINFQQTEARFSNRRDTRVASLSFNWRFGKPIKAPANRKSGGASDEQNRVKVGNGN